MKIFYSHHLWKYNTEIEKYELDLIRKTFPDAEIINPNGDLGSYEGLTEDQIMDICISSVKSCDILVFSSLSGVIGNGVYGEVHAANDIYYLNNHKIEKCNNINFHIINESRRIYAIVEVGGDCRKIFADEYLDDKNIFVEG